MYKIIESKQTEKSFILKVKIDQLWSEEVKKVSLLEAKKIKIPGFRQGNAPFERVRKYLNFSKIFQTAVSKCLQKVVPLVLQDDILKKQNIIQHSYPEVDISKLEESFIEVEMKFPSTPKIELPDYKKIKIDVSKKTISDDDVKEALKKILDEDAEMIVKDGEIAENDDIAVVSYTGRVDGHVENRLCARSAELLLNGEESFEGFTKQIIGMKLHETKKVKMFLPKHYPLKDLAEKQVEFTVTLEELKTLKYPQMNAEIVEKITNGEVKSPDEIDAWMKKDLQKREENRYIGEAKNQLTEYLLKHAKFAFLPDTIEHEYEKRINNLQSFFRNQMRTDLEKVVASEGLQIDEFKKTLHDDVEKNVKFALLARQIAKDENLLPTSAELGTYRETLKNSKNSEDIQLSRLDNDELETQYICSRVIDALYKWNCLEV